MSFTNINDRDIFTSVDYSLLYLNSFNQVIYLHIIEITSLQWSILFWLSIATLSLDNVLVEQKGRSSRHWQL